MRPRVGLVVSSPDSPGVHPDAEIALVSQALDQQGLEPVVAPWTDSVDWSALSLVVLKSPWDYSLRTQEFSAWLASVAPVATVLNHPGLISWNFDKRYLGDLDAAGVAVTPFVCVASAAAARAELARRAGRRVVVKPTVSAGSRNTGLFEADDPRAVELVELILRLGKTPMVLPALDSVERVGEHGLIFFGGEFSHCGRKGPILERGGSYRGGAYTERIDVGTPAPDEIELARSCLRAASDIAHGRGVPEEFAVPLYARIDVARDEDGAPRVLEAELFEPSYFLRLDPSSAERFAAAVSGIVPSARERERRMNRVRGGSANPWEA
ncbi:ATP-grasp domain-containing protein [Actinotalea solisilvae]|uniref:ATP-grasp domain-containing protein n=1 Tax=Actinotalea solisilvae TaxID=2072922 RepID=UPI001F39F6FC|nr:hypothetical protein [Actinotalea solisilvae]